MKMRDAGDNRQQNQSGTSLTRRFAGGLSVLDRAAGGFGFSALAAMAGALNSATVGDLTLIMAGLAPARDATAIVLIWWIGEAAGDIV